MSSFSNRLGITKPKSALQLEAMDSDLRNGLWQACSEHFFHQGDGYSYDFRFHEIMTTTYVDFFKRTSDDIPYGYSSGIEEVRGWFYNCPWWGAYNFVEFLISVAPDDEFVDRVSFFLEREKSGYRVLNGQLVPITDEVELKATAEAASLSSKYAGAREHIRTAIALFSKKPNPDYRNSIKEAISAVESAARIVTKKPKATLGDALKVMEKSNGMHSAMKEGMSKLYGYTSDAAGIRHALLDESNVDEAEAKFMIVACSAFVNFCVQRA